MIGIETLEDAMAFAIEKHRGQTRKGDGRPYIMHPMSVMNRIYRAKTGLLATSGIGSVGTAASYHLGNDNSKSYSLTKNLLNYIINALSNRKINYVVIK